MHINFEFQTCRVIWDVVYDQVLNKYKDSQLREGSYFDADSIMIYNVPEALTDGRYHIDWNYELSEEDKRFIAKMYPGR